jgi:hypothetical protein
VPAAPAKTYKIGDTGPAGGIVFYDKFNSAGGWRYLEAAPISTEWPTVQWSSEEFNVSGTRSEIGTGKKNTESIVTYADQNEKSAHAATVCDTLVSGGYDDWFMPSLDELDLMYKNLKQKGLSGFKDDQYWSSSQNDTNSAWNQSFSNGSQSANWTPYANLYDDSGRKIMMHLVRAIRRF